MIPLKVHNSFLKAFMLIVFALMAFAGNAAAQCGGKTVYIQMPSDWSKTSFYIYWEGSFVSVSATQQGDWSVFTFPSLRNDGSNHVFTFSMRDDYESGNRWIGSGSGRYNTTTQPQQDAQMLSCNAFGTSSTIYIYPNPNSLSTAVVSTTPPDAYYFYFYPPDEEKWIVGTPYILTYSSSNGTTAKKMEVDNSRCGWYKAVYFNETPPSGDVLTFIALGTDLSTMDLIGWRGTEDPWDSGMPEPIDLMGRFNALLGSSPSIPYEIFFVPSQGQNGWSRTDPGINDRNRCYYEMAAIIYDSDWSVMSGAFKCGEYQNGDGTACPTPAYEDASPTGSGINRGIPMATLDANRKMQWRGQGNSPNNNSGTAANDGWTSSSFIDAFKETSGKTIQRCYNMPFERNSKGLWEFDSDRLCTNGSMDPDGVCANTTTVNYGGLMGGFFPPELQGNVDSDGTIVDYSSCPSCNTTRMAETWVPLLSTVNQWCYDRGWLGTGTAEGNLEGLTTKAALDAEMQRACGTGSRAFIPGDLRNGDTPEIWDWGNRTCFGQPKGYSWNSCTDANKTRQKNMLFCFESHSEFTYEKGQEFFFRGDDDIWIFVNNHLAIDLGGSHLAAPGYVLLDTITQPERLVEGQKYNIDIFFCDSRTTMSNVRITTNMYFSQSSGWSVNGTPQREDAHICLTVQTTGNKCGSAGGSTNQYCGTDIGDKLEYYLTRVGPGTELNLSLANPACSMDGNRLRCYGGISIDLNEGIVRIETDRMTGLSAGTYKVQARVKQMYQDAYPAPPLEIAQFSLIAGISVVWGEISKDDADGTPAGLIRDLGPREKSTVAGRLVPVGFAGGTWTGDNKFEVSMDQYDGSPGKTFRLDQTGLTVGDVQFSELKVYADELGETEISPSTTLTIPESGLLVLWFAGELRAADDATYRVNISGVNTEGANITVYLPRVKFIDPETASSGTPTILSLTSGNCRTKGSEYICPNSTLAAGGDQLKAWLGSSLGRTVAAYDVSESGGQEPGKLCTDCNFQLERKQVWATNRLNGLDAGLGSNNELIQFSNLPRISNGTARIDFSGVVEILPENYAFFTIGGPSAAAKTLAQWDSLVFEKPIVPIPISAEIYDRNGDGIGDSIRIAYDVAFVANGNRIDSLPNMIEIFWDLSLTDIISVGPARKTDLDGGGYEYASTGFTGNQILSWWQDNHKLEGVGGRDSIIVITIDDENGFSGGKIKTSVGPGNIVVNSWATFADSKQGGKATNISTSARIKDRIPPIVISARYEGDEASNCSSSGTGCRDVVIINLSEPVIVPEGGVSDNAVKTAFAYKLQNLKGTGAPFEVYERNEDLATRMVWSPSGRTQPSASGDSVVNFTFQSYKIPNGDTTNTPAANDSVKLASLLQGVSVPALLDLAAEEGFPGNSANPKEIGRLIEGKNRSQSVKIPIAELDPNYDIFEDRLTDIFGKDPDEIKEMFSPKDNGGNGGNNALLPVPEEWIRTNLDSAIKANYPASVGMVFEKDVASFVREFENKYGYTEGTIPDEAISFHANVFYHTNLGDYVVHRKGMYINCDDDIFKAYGASSCRDLSNKQGVYVAWNLKDAKDRWAGAGAYVGIYDYFLKIEFGGHSETYEKTERKIEMFGIKRVKRK